METTGQKPISCTKCNDTGWFQYDHNHSQVCNQCCKHDKGWWLLSQHYGEGNRKWCCLGGCGKTLSYKEVIKKLKSEANHYPLIMNIERKK